jgi:CheY-like chemotaxis protein
VLPGGRSVAKILVADDNSNIQKMVGLALKDQGIDVVAVGNGEAAVRKIADVKPDLILADVFMPVRNGYEVCRYVKQESGLSHIPVILLVGAFDPLDEQEAQRVGADGVLKKPFVPPDPLISMVKSALTRAGVPLGPTSHAEKPAAAPSRSAADLLGSGSPKLAALNPQRIPEATPEPIEEFPTAPPSLKIAAGHEPVAFGSLLETTEAEEETLFQPKSPVQLGSKWSEEGDEVEEEVDEEDSPRGGWHPSALEDDQDKAAAPSHAVPDWREQAFHGTPPGKSHSSHGWTPSPEPSRLTEAAESPAVAISTIESKPSGPVPFSGDAWAAAMAAGAEEKLSEISTTGTQAAEERGTPQAQEAVSEEPRASETASFPSTNASETSDEETKEAQPPSSWFSVSRAPWEIEVRKATLLASTWDTPIANSPEDTQELFPTVTEEPASPLESVSQASTQVQLPELETHEASSTAPVESTTTKSWESAWEAPAAPVLSFEPVVERVAEVAEPKVEEDHAAEPLEAMPEPQPAATVMPQSAQPDMDELVARVLGKMNPDVLQKVTREILKPVIEAIIRGELDSNKS